METWLSLEEKLNITLLDSIHKEICHVLVNSDHLKTAGGFYKSTGLYEPIAGELDAVDYWDAIHAMNNDEYDYFCSLGNQGIPNRDQNHFGGVLDHDMTDPQIRYLTYYHGVYFPWRIEFILQDALITERGSRFATLLSYVESLPFEKVDTVVLIALPAFNHTPTHRDLPLEDGSNQLVRHTLFFTPGGSRRYYVLEEGSDKPTMINSRLFFLDVRYRHGVFSLPTWNYSIRVDGIFENEFVDYLADNGLNVGIQRYQLR